MGKRNIPGSVFARKLKNGDYLYYKSIHTNQKAISTGLIDTKRNRNLCWEILEKLHRNSFLPEEKNSIKTHMTIKECFEEFLDYSRNVKKLKESTISNYEWCFTNIISRDFLITEGTNNGTKINYEIENRVKEFVLKSELSANSVNVTLRGFGAFINYLIEEGFINPISLKRYKQKIQEKEVVVYTKNQIRNIISYFDSINKPRIANWITYLAITGSRRTESLDLKWEYVNFDERYLLMPKKNDSARFDKFPISNYLFDLLKSLEIESKERQDPRKRELVFGWIAENAKTYLNREMKKALVHLGIKVKGSLFHPIRKSFGTSIIESNNSYYAQSLMRHEDPKITKDHYWKRDYEKLNDVLSDYEKDIVLRAPSMHQK